MIAFGPVPSRRLGKSLGINNIPPKTCTYSCVYCQLGRTPTMSITRKAFYTPKEILAAVTKKVHESRQRNEHIDYLTFVADGEPTLDNNLGEEIELLKELGIKIAVVTNSSLLWDEKVRNDLFKADWVSVKIDAIHEKIWRTIDRPHGYLQIQDILKGISTFSEKFTGHLTTETMLIKTINDTTEELKKIADFISTLHTKKSYIAIPTRPPSENWVKPATEQIIAKAYQIFREKKIAVEYLIGYEGNAFAYTGNPEADLLSITSVHPMKEEAITEFLSKANSNWHLIESLIKEKKLVEIKYQGNKFYMRTILKK